MWPCEGIARSQRQFGSRCSGRIRCGLRAFETFMGDDRAWVVAIDCIKGFIRVCQGRGGAAMPVIDHWRADREQLRMVHDSKTGTGRAARQAVSSRPTIKDVAEKCGVHPSTVSRALSGAMSHLVAPEVTKRIRAAAAALGYQPNVTAAGLRTGRSGLIGVLAPDIADPGFPPVLSGITETLGAQGYAIIVVDVGPDPSRERELVDRLIARGVDGLVLATVTLHDPIVAHCLAAAVPVVLVNRSDSERRLPAVVTDDQAGMRLAVEHLAGLGHVSIGHIAGPQTVSTGALRAAGFKAAAARAGLSAQNIAIEPAHAYTREQGRLAALRLLDRKNAPTAIVAANDLLALGVYD